ncbi:DUF7002 family protein [Frigoriglobus tundricola]|uniref:DarT domain-containing protein n=1 Tax=Frigoriglobus tundricola TaxID=2774151 RepID=A0A6M5YIV2_9BACT|nr:hypothetical protein [Frigoriglobus tundricola]QJW93935.1 hypothetical protein FTUN_1450 [Frigoriglobus tundricola]
MADRKLPRHVYHMAEATNWASIQATGLLPASRLIEIAGVTGEERRRLEREQRPEHTALPNGVRIRDQKPMPADALRVCLVGVTPAEWYALVNARVFFWLDPERLNRQRAACGPRPQVVLTLDAVALAEAYRESAAVTPINTGNARRKPAMRGAATFIPYPTWLGSAWASEAAALGIPERSRGHAPVELTIAAPIPDALGYVVTTQELGAGQPFDPAANKRAKQT